MLDRQSLVFARGDTGGGGGVKRKTSQIIDSFSLKHGKHSLVQSQDPKLAVEIFARTLLMS